MNVINLDERLAAFARHWSPQTIAPFNDHVLRVAKFTGEFVWHRHDDTDELFLVLNGELQILLRDGNVTVREREMFIVPRGVEHCPRADREVAVLLLEPAVGHKDAGPLEYGTVASNGEGARPRT